MLRWVNRYTFPMLGRVRFTPVSDQIAALRQTSLDPDLPNGA
jgi:hypothetical protein